MKIYTDKVIPASTTKVLIKRQCDLCGASAKNEDWGASMYEVNKTEVTVAIEQKDGSSYPDGGSGDKYEIDLCPKCFKERLVPWLLSQGATIKQEEWDW